MRTMASCGRIVSSVTWNLFWARWVFLVGYDMWYSEKMTTNCWLKLQGDLHMVHLRWFPSMVKSLLCCWQREKRVLGHIAIVTARCQWLRKKILQAWDRQRQVRVKQHESSSFLSHRLEDLTHTDWNNTWNACQPMWISSPSVPQYEFVLAVGL